MLKGHYCFEVTVTNFGCNLVFNYLLCFPILIFSYMNRPISRGGTCFVIFWRSVRYSWLSAASIFFSFIIIIIIIIIFDLIKFHD